MNAPATMTKPTETELFSIQPIDLPLPRAGAERDAETFPCCNILCCA